MSEDQREFDGKREFRAILFQAKSLSTIDAVVRLFPRDSVPPREVEMLNVPTDDKALPGGFEVVHGRYYSSKEYVPREFLDREGSIKGKFRYHFYLAKWQNGRSACFFFAVPFLEMAIDVFGFLDSTTKKAARKFKSVNLAELVKQLSAGSEDTSQIAVTSLRFIVLADGENARSVTLTGKNIMESESYLRSCTTAEDLGWTPRRMRIAYRHSTRPLSLETDSAGNYWLRVRDKGRNLPWLHGLLRTLNSCAVFQDVGDFPLGARAAQSEE